MTSELEGFNAVLYARVSTDDKGQTNETQIREMKKWCESKGVEILEIFEDEVSGKNLNRPAFRQMIGRIAAGGVNILLSWDVSRLTRGNQLQEIEKMVSPFKTQIRYVTISSEPSTFAGEIETSIKEKFSKEERAMICKRTKLAMETLKIKGVYCGRPIAVVLSEKVATTPGVKFDGKHPTKVVTKKIIIECAEDGQYMAQAARTLGIPQKTFYDFLVRENIYEEYNAVLSTKRKGVIAKRVGSINTTDGKTEVE